MDGTCNITSRLVDVQTSEIVHAKESNGNVSKWLSLKTVLARELSSALNNPVHFEDAINDLDEEAIEVYAKSIYYSDNELLDSAFLTLQELKYSYTDFSYTSSLLDKLYNQASQSQANLKLRQKGFILKMHEKITGEPEKDWKVIERFLGRSIG